MGVCATAQQRGKGCMRHKKLTTKWPTDFKKLRPHLPLGNQGACDVTTQRKTTPYKKLAAATSNLNKILINHRQIKSTRVKKIEIANCLVQKQF
jgi:hypothetical protein